MAKLFFLGKRRPSSLSTQADFKETGHDGATRNAYPKKGALPEGVKGKHLGGRQHGKKGRK